MEEKYKVIPLQDSTYQVIQNSEDMSFSNVVYQGSLADCEAWIRLTLGGYL